MTATTQLQSRPQALNKSKFRLDIQGLRAIAVLAVLLYHAGLPWAAGGYIGVDIFFVISGFLITLGIVREIETTGSFSFKDFYTRRAARILPAATVTLIAVIALSFVILPQTRWAQIWKDVLGSILYVVNWMFAGSSTDYMARDQASSPVQHFWSLAIEEQFYIVWPLLIVVIVGLAVWFGRSETSGFVIALAIVGIPSLAWSIYLTNTNPGAAYFVTTTRAWELCIGAAVAILASRINLKAVQASVLGWLGFAAIVYSFLTFDSTTVFPGYAAALPVLGAAAVIVAGKSDQGPFGADRLLSLRPMVLIGTISYSLYLWHWPLLVFAEYIFGELTWVIGVGVIVVSLIPAWASYFWVEQPFLRYAKKASSPTQPLKSVGVMTLGAVVLVALFAVAIPPTAPTPVFNQVVDVPAKGAAGTPAAVALRGAALVMTDPAVGTPKDSFAEIIPNYLIAADDKPSQACIQEQQKTEVIKCTYGDKESSKSIALVGDSHAGMYVPGLNAAGIEMGFRVDTYLKGVCPWSAVAVLLDGNTFNECTEWGTKVTEALTSGPAPSAIVTANSRYKVAEPAGLDLGQSASYLAEGMSTVWQPLLDNNIPVIAIRTALLPGMNIPECISKNVNKLTNCVLAKHDIEFRGSPEVLAAEATPGVKLLDLTDAVCPTDQCAPVIDGIIVYRDSNHLTATYSSTLKNSFVEALQEVTK